MFARPNHLKYGVYEENKIILKGILGGDVWLLDQWAVDLFWEGLENWGKERK